MPFSQSLPETTFNEHFHQQKESGHISSLNWPENNRLTPFFAQSTDSNCFHFAHRSRFQLDLHIRLGRRDKTPKVAKMISAFKGIFSNQPVDFYLNIFNLIFNYSTLS